jgi:hypothetical protein
MMRSLVSKLLVGTLALVVAGNATDLAAPVRCAEPRSAVDLRVDDAFPVAGPVAALFDPVDVAANSLAGDPRFSVARPGGAQALVRPGACDQPGAGCGGVQAVQSVVTVPPIIPGTRPPRAPR